MLSGRCSKGTLRALLRGDQTIFRRVLTSAVDDEWIVRVTRRPQSDEASHHLPDLDWKLATKQLRLVGTGNTLLQAGHAAAAETFFQRAHEVAQSSIDSADAAPLFACPDDLLVKPPRYEREPALQPTEARQGSGKRHSRPVLARAASTGASGGPSRRAPPRALGWASSGEHLPQERGHCHWLQGSLHRACPRAGDNCRRTRLDCERGLRGGWCPQVHEPDMWALVCCLGHRNWARSFNWTVYAVLMLIWAAIYTVVVFFFSYAALCIPVVAWHTASQFVLGFFQPNDLAKDFSVVEENIHTVQEGLWAALQGLGFYIALVFFGLIFEQVSDQVQQFIAWQAWRQVSRGASHLGQGDQDTGPSMSAIGSLGVKHGSAEGSGSPHSFSRAPNSLAAHACTGEGVAAAAALQHMAALPPSLRVALLLRQDPLSVLSLPQPDVGDAAKVCSELAKTHRLNCVFPVPEYALGLSDDERSDVYRQQAEGAAYVAHFEGFGHTPVSQVDREAAQDAEWQRGDAPSPAWRGRASRYAPQGYTVFGTARAAETAPDMLSPWVSASTSWVPSCAVLREDERHAIHHALLRACALRTADDAKMLHFVGSRVWGGKGAKIPESPWWDSAGWLRWTQGRGAGTASGLASADTDASAARENRPLTHMLHGSEWYKWWLGLEVAQWLESVWCQKWPLQLHVYVAGSVVTGEFAWVLEPIFARLAGQFPSCMPNPFLRTRISRDVPPAAPRAGTLISALLQRGLRNGLPTDTTCEGDSHASRCAMEGLLPLEHRSEQWEGMASLEFDTRDRRLVFRCQEGCLPGNLKRPAPAPWRGRYSGQHTLWRLVAHLIRHKPELHKRWTEAICVCKPEEFFFTSSPAPVLRSGASPRKLRRKQRARLQPEHMYVKFPIQAPSGGGFAGCHHLLLEARACHAWVRWGSQSARSQLQQHTVRSRTDQIPKQMYKHEREQWCSTLAMHADNQVLNRRKGSWQRPMFMASATTIKDSVDLDPCLWRLGGFLSRVGGASAVWTAAPIPPHAGQQRGPRVRPKARFPQIIDESAECGNAAASRMQQWLAAAPSSVQASAHCWGVDSDAEEDYSDLSLGMDPRHLSQPDTDGAEGQFAWAWALGKQLHADEVRQLPPSAEFEAALPLTTLPALPIPVLGEPLNAWLPSKAGFLQVDCALQAPFLGLAAIGTQTATSLQTLALTARRIVGGNLGMPVPWLELRMLASALAMNHQQLQQSRQTRLVCAGMKEEVHFAQRGVSLSGEAAGAVFSSAVGDVMHSCRHVIAMHRAVGIPWRGGDHLHHWEAACSHIAAVRRQGLRLPPLPQPPCPQAPPCKLRPCAAERNALPCQPQRASPPLPSNSSAHFLRLVLPPTLGLSTGGTAENAWSDVLDELKKDGLRLLQMDEAHPGLRIGVRGLPPFDVLHHDFELVVEGGFAVPSDDEDEQMGGGMGGESSESDSSDSEEEREGEDIGEVDDLPPQDGHFGAAEAAEVAQGGAAAPARVRRRRGRARGQDQIGAALGEALAIDPDSPHTKLPANLQIAANGQTKVRVPTGIPLASPPRVRARHETEEQLEERLAALGDAPDEQALRLSQMDHLTQELLMEIARCSATWDALLAEGIPDDVLAVLPQLAQGPWQEPLGIF